MRLRLLLLSLLLGTQGIPVPASQSGSIAGSLLDGSGKALSGVRVAAVAVPESITDAANGIAMAAIAETDAEGRYRLENIPPGRYYIAAGRLDLPTYYPGTQEMRAGTIIAVAAGSHAAGIDFMLKDSSAGRGQNLGFSLIVSGPPAVLIPFDVRIDGGGKIPVFGSAGFTGIRFTPTGGKTPTTVSLDTAMVSVTGSPPANYVVTIENLPPEFTLKSLTYGAADLLAGPLQLTAANFSTPLPATTAAGRFYFIVGATLTGTPPEPTITVPPRPPVGVTPGTPLTITLTRVPPRAGRSGVRVTGDTGTRTISARSVYLSGRPGLFFSDGSFEFVDVPPGRHTIAALISSPWAASVVVGNTDLDGVRLERTPVLPVDILTPAPAGPAGPHAPGTIPLASIGGRVVDRDTQEPLPNGRVFMSGGAYGGSFSLLTSGEFQFPRLLPGSYNIEVQASGHETVKRSIVVGDDGIDLRINLKPIPD